MNRFKKILALFLVLCMSITMVPTYTFASESTVLTEETVESGDNVEEKIFEETPDEENAEQIPTETEQTVGDNVETEVIEDKAVQAGVELTSVEDEAADIETDAPEKSSENGNTEIMTADLDDAEVAVSSLTLGTKPEDGTVSGDPFNESVSKNYRIPGLVTLNDGTLIASADARWNYEKDGGGMDLVVSRSTDGGTTWNYTFAGYLGDNGNKWNASSSTMMDPVIMTDGETLYLLADMFPAGYSISSSSTSNVFSETGTGYASNGCLMLSGDNRASYNYYLKDGAIYDSDGTEVSGYSVDSWFNLYQGDTYVTNLFFSDSPYQLYPTSYISMQTSTDGGKTWSAPTMVNAKPEDVTWMVLGPGAGLVNKDGDLAFTAYDNSNIYLIWGSSDKGWSRVSTSAATNESSIVELADGTIRAFVKRSGSNTIAYVDFTKSNSGYTAGELVDTGVANFSNCMVSSLKYSKTIDGKEALFVCCPSKSDAGAWAGRFNGTIYAFTLDDSNNMTLLDSYQINNSFFAYSNMTERADGSIDLLYEDDCISYSAGNYGGTSSNRSHIAYKNIAITDIVGDAQIGESAENVTVTDEDTDVSVTAPDLSKITIEKLAESTPEEGYNKSVTYSIELYDKEGKLYTGSATVKVPAGELAGCSKYIGTVGDDNFDVAAPVDGYFTLNVPHFSDVKISGYALDNETVDIVLYEGKSKTVTIDGAAYTSGSVESESTATIKVENMVTEEEVKVSTTAAIELNSGHSYLIAIDGTESFLTSKEVSRIWSGTHLDVGKTGYVAENKNVWTLEASGTGYLIKSSAGKYLSLGTTTNQATLGTTGEVFGITWNDASDAWIVGTTTPMYLNDLGGYNTDVGGWTGDGTKFEFYEVITVPTNSTTTVTFTGVSEGTTTATVGHVTYNITVLKAAKAGNISDFNNIVGVDTYSDDNQNATYRSDLDMAGKEITSLTISAGATFHLGIDTTEYDSVEWIVADTSIATVDENGNVTGVKEGSTTVTATVVKDGIIESISIPVNVKASLVAEGQESIPILYYIEELQNTTPYYTMYLSSNGTEPVYSMVEAKEGEVIYLLRPSGTAYAWLWTATPDKGHALALMTSSGSIAEYYPLKDSDGNLGSGTADDVTKYYVGNNAYNNIVDVGNEAGTSWTNSLHSILNESIGENYKCDGAMSMTRWDHDGVPKLVTSMTFISDPTPEVDKTVRGILPLTRLQKDFRTYYDGMVATVGEYVYFQVDVTLNRPTVWADDAETISAITYTDAILTDNVLDGAYFYTKELDQADGTYDGVISEGNRKQTQTVTDELNKAWAADEEVRTVSFYVVYEIQEGDIPKFHIENTAELAFSYDSKYSKGTLHGSADADATITVVGYAMDNVVVDFGQSVTITDLTDEHLKFVSLGEGTGDAKHVAKYGTVSVSKDGEKYSVTYTPTTVLQEPDAVQLMGTYTDGITGEEVTKVINGFIVYPATTVHYEEGFTFNDESTGWTVTDAEKATMNQTLEYFGKSQFDENKTLIDYARDKKHEYGYDPIYDDSTTYSGGSYATTSIMGATTSFEITGTGLEVFADCTEETGYVSVMIQNSAGKTVKFYMVNTAALNGTTNATNNQKGDFYGTPIVSVDGLAHDTYTVTLTKIMESDKPVYIDGIRVFNTVEDSSIYAIDLEDNPEYYQLRDVVLKALEVGDVTASEYGSISEMAKQVYAGITEDSEQPAAILTNSAYAEDINVQDLLDNGPKNELFLRGGQTLVFRVETSRLMQLGLSAPAGETAYTITTKYTDEDETEETIVGEEKTLKSSVDMFYELGNPNGTEYTYTVTVTNNGDKILSVTDLKICDDPNAAFSNLTEKDVEYALVAMGYEEEPVYADAVLNISLADTDGAVLAATSLTANGIVGETATFTAAAIEEEAASVLPEGYELKDAVYEDTAVAYGEETAVNFTAEEIVEEETDAIETIVTKIFFSIKNLFKKLFG